MKLCFNQPCFIPWGGFFCRLLASDVMVLLDDTLFAQGFTFVNRNRLKGPDGEIWITVPLKRGRGRRRKIREMKIYEPEYWSKKWQRTLYHTYGRSLYYREISSELEKIMKRTEDRFIDLVAGIIGLMKSKMEIDTPIRWQSETGIQSGGIQLIIELAEELKAREVILPYYSQTIIPWKEMEGKGIKVTFLHYLSPVYPQFWGSFLKNLSLLDMLFCLGPKSRKVLDNGYRLVSY